MMKKVHKESKMLQKRRRMWNKSKKNYLKFVQEMLYKHPYYPFIYKGIQSSLEEKQGGVTK